MPVVLLATDLERDPAIESFVGVLRAHGFGVEVVRPMLRVLDVLAVVSLSLGKVDAVVLAHQGWMTSSIPDPLVVARQIRCLPEERSFLGAVRARTVPLVLLANEQVVLSSSSVRWLGVLDPELLIDRPLLLVEAVVSVIGSWRQSLLEDLEYVGFAVTLGPVGSLEVSHALVRGRRSGEIITDAATPGGLRAGQYLILAEDVLSSFEPYTKLKYLLNHYRALAAAEGVKPESVFQRFFVEHPHLLRRDVFDQHWSQPQLRLPGSAEFYRPDFVLRPRVGAEVGTKWQVLDLKLPEDSLLVSRGFHASLSAKLTRAIQQLQDYREYFNRPEAAAELVRRFGVQPQNPRLAVLIGRSGDDAEAVGLAKAQGPRHLDVEVITYDEIVDFEERRLVLHSALARAF